MARLSAKAAAMGLAAAVAVVVGAGIVYDKVNHRRQVWAEAAADTGGSPSRGEAMFIQYGCGSCHAMAHVRTATGAVGPSLDGLPDRAIIAGKLANSSANLQHWIRDPQQVSPGTAMPDLNVGEQDARDIAAFLYTRGK